MSDEHKQSSPDGFIAIENSLASEYQKQGIFDYYNLTILENENYLYSKQINAANMKKSQQRMIPNKKISSDKKKRVVNADRNKMAETDSEGRPMSKTGNINELNHYRSNERKTRLVLI